MHPLFIEGINNPTEADENDYERDEGTTSSLLYSRNEIEEYIGKALKNPAQ
jgi:hypothetical protein